MSSDKPHLSKRPYNLSKFPSHCFAIYVEPTNQSIDCMVRYYCHDEVCLWGQTTTACSYHQSMWQFNETVETKGLWSITPEERRKYSKNTVILTFMPTLVLCMSTRARRSLLERLPRKSLTNLLAYLRLSPQPPHCHALRFSRSGASSQVQRSMRPALHALANAWVKPAEEMAYKKAVSLKPVE